MVGWRCLPPPQCIAGLAPAAGAASSRAAAAQAMTDRVRMGDLLGVGCTGTYARDRATGSAFGECHPGATYHVLLASGPSPSSRKVGVVSLHTDIPTRAQVARLLNHRGRASVAIYVPTDPSSSGQAERIELGNLAAEAERQLVEGGVGKRDVAALVEGLDELREDSEFWRFQARCLAIFATPQSTVTYRLPHRLVALVEVSDRFHVKPLLRAVTFPQV